MCSSDLNCTEVVYEFEDNDLYSNRTYDNLNVIGYCTSSKINNIANYVWEVDCYGRLTGEWAISNVDFGVRPVITINKNILN